MLSRIKDTGTTAGKEYLTGAALHSFHQARENSRKRKSHPVVNVEAHKKHLTWGAVSFGLFVLALLPAARGFVEHTSVDAAFRDFVTAAVIDGGALVTWVRAGHHRRIAHGFRKNKN